MKIAIYVSGRSDGTLLYPIIEALAQPGVEVTVLLGSTEPIGEELRALPVTTKTIWAEVGDPSNWRTDFFARTFQWASASLPGHDWLIVYGDRVEAFACATAASILRIPIAHIEGGDITLGGLTDDQHRFAVTSLATLHFPTTEQSAQVLMRLGIRPENIQVIGVPSLALPNTWRPVIARPTIVLCQQPMPGDPKSQIKETLWALDEIQKEHEVDIIPLAPCKDPGHEAIYEALRGHFDQVHDTLGAGRFLGTLKAIGQYGGCMVGNSSAGIKEAPYFKVPVVNIRPRQDGRMKAPHVLDVRSNGGQGTLAALRVALSKPFQELCRQMESPYDAHANPGGLILHALMNWTLP